MTIFEFSDYRLFLRLWLRAQPKAGRGLLRAWSQTLRVHPTLLSQILSGKRQLNLDFAEQIGEQLSLGDAELDYFFELVLLDQAGTARLKKRIERKIAEAQNRAKRIAERVKIKHELSEADRAEFYCSWHYSGIRNLSAITGKQNPESISRHLGLPRETVMAIINFLLQSGLCVEKDGHLEPGPQRTYIPPHSPLVQKHHQNWRLHGFSKMILRREDDLFFTFPISLSEKDADRIRKMLPAWVEEVNGIVGPSPSETVRCLNIDFFAY